MKYHIFLIVTLFALIIIASCEKEIVPKPVQDKIPTEYDINDPVFAHARQELLEHIHNCGNGVVEGIKDNNKCSYTVKLNKHFFMHPADKTGFKKDERIFYDNAPHFFLAHRNDVPDNFSVLDLIEGEKPTPGDQGNCGSCWSYSTHQGLEIIRALKDKKLFDLSPQTILSCSGYGSCGGGTMEAPTFLMHGLPLESEFPYAAKDLKCKFTKDQISTGWDGKAIDAPWVGSSLDRSRYFISHERRQDSFKTVADIKAAMWALRSPAIVTVVAYSVGSGVYDVCSKGAWTNHMVVVSSFAKSNGKDIAEVYNSWGRDFGVNGIGKQVWVCPDGTLVRRLGEEARVINYKPECAPPEDPKLKANEMIFQGSTVVLGKKINNVKCKWLPELFLDDPNSCETKATPDKSIEYHLEVSNECGTTSAMTLIKVFGPLKEDRKLFEASKNIITPHGVTEDPGF